MKKNLDKIIEKCQNISPLYFSLIINVIFLVSYLIFGNIKYEVSDDFIMQLIVSGKYSGTPSPEIVFMNISIGYILSTLYKIIPFINWYFWMHVVVIFSSLTTLTYLVLKQRNTMLTQFLLFIFLCFFTPDLYLLVQFTKTATIAIAVGGVLYCLYLLNEKKNYLVLGIIFSLIGICIRKNCINIILPYFLFAIALIFIYQYQVKKINKKIILNFLIIVVITVTQLIGLTQLNQLYKNTHEEYKNYAVFNSYRSKALDFPYYEYKNNEEKLKELGLSENDYINFIHWNYFDSDIYNVELFENISEILDDYRDSHPAGKKASIKVLLERDYYKYISVLGCLCIFIIGSYYYKNFFTVSLLAGLGTGIIFFLYSYMGRIVYRVEYSTLLSCAVFLLLLSVTLPMYKKSIKKEIILILSFLMILMRIPLHIDDTSNSFYTMFFSMKNSVRKYNCEFNNENQHNEIINELKEHQDNLYFFGFQTMLQTYYLNFNPVKSINDVYFENVVFLSGVETEHPVWKSKLSDWNIENPAKGLLLDNVYLIENVDQEIILQYLNEHSDKKITMELYKELNGYKVWKFKEK